jgi:hypothetical protein
MQSNGDEFNEDELYDSFPDGAEAGFGPNEGFNSYLWLNNEELFTEEAREHPVIRAFLDAPFEVRYVQFKSSTRESEWALHKPHLAMTGQVPGIEGSMERLSREDPRIGTFIINHENTMAFRIWRSLVIADETHSGEMIHKEK